MHKEVGWFEEGREGLGRASPGGGEKGFKRRKARLHFIGKGGLLLAEADQFLRRRLLVLRALGGVDRREVAVDVLRTCSLTGRSAAHAFDLVLSAFLPCSFSLPTGVRVSNPNAAGLRGGRGHT